MLLVGRRWEGSVGVASCRHDGRSLQHGLLVGVPHELCRTSAGVPVAAHLRVVEELPASASGAVLPGGGSPRLRDGGAVRQTAQNVDGTQQNKRGTFLFDIYSRWD